MNRRNFLKGILGAAGLAAVPVIAKEPGKTSYPDDWLDALKYNQAKKGRNQLVPPDVAFDSMAADLNKAYSDGGYIVSKDILDEMSKNMRDSRDRIVADVFNAGFK